MIGLILGCVAAGAFILFVLVMAARAARLKPDDPVCDYVPVDVDSAELTEMLVGAVRIPTITKFAPDADQSAFAAYREYLKKTFPEIFSRAEVAIINEYSLAIRIDGSDPTLLPACLLSHQDVVPAPIEGWEVDPFSGEVRDGYVYGRGSQDMKSHMIAALYGMETLLREGREPTRTLYYCFGHDEEATGVEGARNISKYLKERGVRLEFVLDEGGAIIDGAPLGIGKKVALIGVCEKGYADFVLRSARDGGHASAPRRKSSVDAIAEVICAIRRRPMKATWSKPLVEMFETLAPHMNPAFRFLFANRAVFSPLLKAALSLANPVTNSVLRTTFAFTQLKGSDAPNVIPGAASAVANARINIGETHEAAKAHLEKIAGPDVSVEYLGTPFNPTPVSRTKGSDAYDKLARTLREVFPGFAVAPFPFIAATDAKHYCDICDCIYRMGPFEMSPDDQNRIHAVNERCEIKSLAKAAQFFRRLIENVCY